MQKNLAMEFFMKRKFFVLLFALFTMNVLFATSLGERYGKLLRQAFGESVCERRYGF